MSDRDDYRLERQQQTCDHEMVRDGNTEYCPKCYFEQTVFGCDDELDLDEDFIGSDGYDKQG